MQRTDGTSGSMTLKVAPRCSHGARSGTAAITRAIIVASMAAPPCAGDGRAARKALSVAGGRFAASNCRDRENPYGARQTLALPRHGGAAYLLTEPAARGVANADQYLDKVLQRRRTERAGAYEVGARSNATVGSLSGRQLEAAWTADGVRHREIVVAGLDGWMGFALVAWMPETTAGRSNGIDALARGLSARGLLAVRLKAAVDAATAAVPHLSAPAAEQLMAQSEARVLEPDQAFRRSFQALAENIEALTPAEKAELTRLTTATYSGVAWKDRASLAAYVERVRKGQTTTPEEDKAMAALLRDAESRLSGEGRLKLQGFYEKAILAKN